MTIGTNLAMKGLQVQSGQLQLPDEQNDISCRGMMTMIFIIIIIMTILIILILMTMIIIEP